RPDSACRGHAQLDDRVGRPALFLGSRQLSRLVRRRGFSAALPRMEHRDARNRLGPSVAGLNCDSTIGLRLTPILQEGRKSVNLQARSGFIWGIPVLAATGRK